MANDAQNCKRMCVDRKGSARPRLLLLLLLFRMTQIIAHKFPSKKTRQQTKSNKNNNNRPKTILCTVYRLVWYGMEPAIFTMEILSHKAIVLWIFECKLGI